MGLPILHVIKTRWSNPDGKYIPVIMHGANPFPPPLNMMYNGQNHCSYDFFFLKNCFLVKMTEYEISSQLPTLEILFYMGFFLSFLPRNDLANMFSLEHF